MATYLNVVISGGGLVGLTTALALRRIGHSVKIFEKSSFSSEVGAAVSISPDATRFIESLGIDLKASGCVPWKALNVINAFTLKDVMPPMPVDGEAQYGAPLYSAHRSDIHTALREAAIDQGGLGPPAELFLSSRVTSFDSEAGTVTLRDSSVHTADLLIAGDGVHSQAATYINGYNCPAHGTENTVIRFMLPTQVILDDPITAPLLDHGSGQFTTYVTRDSQKLLAQYDCRGSKLQNYGMYVPKPIMEGEDDHQKAMSSNRAALRQAMEDFHPALQRLCEKTEEILPLWRVTERDPVPRCTKGRLVMIGDAAHPMRPTQGQGFVNGVQDAAVLQVLFEGVKTGNEDLIIERLELFQTIRQARVAAIQLYSSKKIMENPAKTMEAEVRKWLPEGKLPQNQPEMNDWMMLYNAVEHAKKVFAESKK